MEIKKKRNGSQLLVEIKGSIDTNTAVEFGQRVNSDLDETDTLFLDFKNVDYISSMGLRVILELQKTMNQQGVMKLFNVKEGVMHIFEMTGFVKILTIE